MPGTKIAKPRTVFILSLAGAVLLVLFFWFYIRSFEVPAGAYPSVGPMEIAAPDGATRLAPATWFQGAGSDRSFQPGLYRFSFAIPVSSPDPGRAWLLFLPQTYGNAVRANVGGVDVGTLGDMEKGDSNIWSPGKVFRVKPGLVGASTKVVLEIRGRYEAGFTKRPYLMPADAGMGQALFFRLFTDLGIWLLCGAILTLGIVILVIGSFSMPRFDARFYFGFAAVCAAIFLSDFQSIEYIPFGLLAFKRAVSIFRHLSAGLFGMAVCCMLGRKKDWFAYAYAALQAVLIVLLFLPRSMPELKRAYSLTYLGIFPVLVYLPIALILRYRERKQGGAKRRTEKSPPPFGYGLLLFGSFAGIGTGMYDTVVLMIRPGSVCVSQYGFFILFISVAAYVITDILGHFRQLVVEKIRSERFQQEALRDHLTEAFNRKILPLILDETRMRTAVVMVDLDDLKGINDNYGHPVGDLVLKDLVTTMRHNIRQSDYLVRLGGDEFIVFLPGCPDRKLEYIVKHFLADIEQSRVSVADHADTFFSKGEPKETSLGYRASIGTAVSGDEGIPNLECLQELMERADQALYKSKTAGKAQATFG